MLFRFLLGEADAGDLRDGVDAHGEGLVNAFEGVEVEHVGDGDAALVHAGAGESGEADDIAGGVDIGRGGAVMVVHVEELAFVRRDADGFEVEAGGATRPAGGVEEHVGLNLCIVGKLGGDDGFAVTLGDSDALGAVGHEEPDAVGFHFAAQDGEDFAVHEGEEFGVAIDEGGLGAEGVEDGGVFAANDAGTDDDDGVGDVVNFEDGVGVVDALAVEGNAREVKRVGAGGDEDELALEEEGRVVGGFDLDGVGVHERAVAGEDVHLEDVHAVANFVGLAGGDGVFAKEEVLHTDGALELALEAEESAVVVAGEEEGGFLEGFGGEGAGVGAGAAEAGFLFDEGDGAAVEGGEGGGFFPGWAGADDDEVVGRLHEGKKCWMTKFAG